MRPWAHRLELGDVFHDEARTFIERRDEIVRRIKAAPFWNDSDGYLVRVTDELGAAEDADWFDAAWDGLYDWFDLERVWVETHRARSDA